MAFAISLDGFGVGISYGLRRITIPMFSVMVITFCTAGALFSSMKVGALLINVLSTNHSKMLGGIILILVGSWNVYNIYRSSKKSEESDSLTAEKSSVFSFQFKKFLFIINIVRLPQSADLDKSGVISGGEALLLGLALSLDAMGAGIGASLMGLSPMITSLITCVMSSVFLLAGLRVGHFYSTVKWVKRFNYVPAMLLILFGILKLF
ncbi:sporulation membrane protein YtaF [Priestia megaterium]|nr:sporulation membrane protein YtaF [Priestia megaterium]